MKVYLPNDSWMDETKFILNGSRENFEFQSKYAEEPVEKIPWWKKFSIRREPAVGGPGLEELVPLLQQGVDVFLEVRNSYPYIAIELWSLYDFVYKKYKSLKTTGSFQTITDYIVGEAGDTPLDQRSITFIWSPDLTKKEFDSLAEKVIETRKFINEVLSKLDEHTIRQINYIECKVVDNEWKVNIINK